MIKTEYKGHLKNPIDKTAELISEYVEKGPTKFCTFEEYRKGVDTLCKFCELRTESVKGQISGTTPSTTEGQSADSSSLIDASEITISDMGTMNVGGKGGKGGFGGSDKSMPNTENANSLKDNSQAENS